LSPFELNKPDYLLWGALRSGSASSSTPAGCVLQLIRGLGEAARGAKSGCATSNKHCFFFRSRLLACLQAPSDHACAREHIGRPPIALVLAIECLLVFRCRQCHHRTALASLATLATSCGWPREMKATRQSLGSHTSRRGIRFWRSVGKRSLLLVLPLVFRLALTWTSSERALPLSGAKPKNLTSRHPMNNSHVADPSQPSAPYHTNANPLVGMGMCANKIMPGFDLIGNLVGKGVILLGGTWGGP
jgi:hypothetical protein